MKSWYGSLCFIILAMMNQSLMGEGILGKIKNAQGGFEKIGQHDIKETPLGSIYKLFLFTYLIETKAEERPFQCSTKNPHPEEIFCCERGEVITRNEAIAKSCSLYFSQDRLGILKIQWRDFWQAHAKELPQWLLIYENIKPELVVQVDELLTVLEVIRKKMTHFTQIENALIGTVLYGTAADSFQRWGSLLRVKTYTWRGQEAKERIDKNGFTGGFAGWLIDGSAIWVSHAGFGRQAFEMNAYDQIASRTLINDQSCVLVNFFDRYPFKVMQDASLLSSFKLRFQNGNEIIIAKQKNIFVSKKGEMWGRFSINEYVARVLQREVEVVPVEAARAFAILIRTYLLQNAKIKDGCFEIKDSTMLQRVSPHAPSVAALAIARWSDRVILTGVENIRYHSTDHSINRLSWNQAKLLANKSYSAIAILNSTYPKAKLSLNDDQGDVCKINLSAKKWLEQQQARWVFLLKQQQGFEFPQKLYLCEASGSIKHKKVYTNFVRNEIFVPKILNEQDELSLIHEYLHIAFKNHPRGRDEYYIENTAKKLQEVL